MCRETVQRRDHPEPRLPGEVGAWHADWAVAAIRPQGVGKATMAQVLQHTGGIPDYIKGSEVPQAVHRQPENGADAAAAHWLRRKRPLDFAPGRSTGTPTPTTSLRASSPNGSSASRTPTSSSSSSRPRWNCRIRRYPQPLSCRAGTSTGTTCALRRCRGEFSPARGCQPVDQSWFGVGIWWNDFNGR